MALQFSANYSFLVVDKLSVPAILGCDFMFKYAFVLDIQEGTAHQMGSGYMYKMSLDTKIDNLCNPLVIDDKPPQVLPSKSTGPSIPDLPEFTHPAVAQVVKEYKSLFSQQIGWTNITHHLIDTRDAPPIKVSLHPIPFHYVYMLTKSRSNSQTW